jgi:adenine-specific DNA methylase
MGAKSRLLPELEAAIAPLLCTRRTTRSGRPPVLVDLFTGTGVVAAHFADRARIVAGDAQRYAVTLARALLEPAPDAEAAGERVLGIALPEEERLARSHRALLEEERVLLEADAAGSDVAAAYRSLVERDLAAQDPERESMAGLVTAYYRNIYFGVAQAVALDGLRRAIEAEPPPVRTTCLAALLYAASRATSATAHFAQPRALDKRSELRAVMARRRIDVAALFRARLAWLCAEARRVAFPGLNEVEAVQFVDLLARIGAGEADVVYADPPYTQDHYSRFYHVLEVLNDYEAPPLARDAQGELLKGRYPVLARRFQSGFSHPDAVAGEFRRVAALTAARGAALVVSYSRTNGLLLRLLRGRLERFEALLRESYRSVTISERELRHSGQGDKNHVAVEIIAVCRRPR